MLTFNDLKIRHKLRILSIFPFLGLILLGAISNYFYNTGKTLSIVINAERIHNLTFQEGIEDYYRYHMFRDEAMLEQAMDRIRRANDMSYTFGTLDQLTGLPKKEFIDTLYYHYKEAYDYKRSNAELMAGRLKLLSIVKTDELAQAQQIAQKGYHLGKEIQELIINSQIDNTEMEASLGAKLDQMRLFYNDFATSINDLIDSVNRLLFLGIILIVLLLIFSIGSVSLYISRSINLPVREMVKQFDLIAKGNIKTELVFDSKNEIGELARSFRKLQHGFREVIDYTKKVAGGDYSSQITPRSEEDELSIALNQMAQNLKESHEKVTQDTWYRAGLNTINDKLNSNDTLQEIARQSILFLTERLHSQLGGIYYFNKDTQHLELLSYLGIDSGKANKFIKLNEGIVGQVANSKQIKTLVDIPEDLYATFSATGNYKPKQVVIVPLIFNNLLIGAIELSSIYAYTDIELEFLRPVSEIIAIKLNSAASRIKTDELLKETQDQASELQVQQEELRVANEELTEHAKVLTENEKKLQVQQEELRVANEELEERTRQLEVQKEDISIKNQELTATHEQLENKAHELQQASQYKSEFLANMSHELRTPLNSLLILSNLLSSNKKGNLTEDQVRSAKIIYKSGSDLLHLINEILDLSKIEAGKMSIEFLDVLSSDLQDEILMNFNALADDKDLAFEVTIDSAFPQKLLTDRYRLMQVVKNLVSNAFKFTSKGKVAVDFLPTPVTTKFRSTGLTTENTCCIKISDTGVGIPQEKLESIFEAFQQADGSISRKFGGTGLGLSISRELIKILGGEIQLESVVNQGSSFYVYLPVEKSQQVQTIEAGSKPAKKEEVKKVEKEIVADNGQATLLPYLEDDRNETGNEQTVLVIHPAKEQAQKLMQQAREKKYKVIVSPTIRDGIALAEKYRPKAVMLAVELATGNRQDYLKLKNHKLLGKLPVHVISPIEHDLEKEQSELKTLETIEFADALKSLEKHFDSSLKKMLIIEDNLQTRELIKTLLFDFDLTIIEAGLAEQAYQLMKNDSFDCIILDLGLPDYSGKELLEKLKSSNIPIPKVIVYTGKEMSQQEIKELESYTNTIILKGIKSDERLMDEVTLFLHQVSQNIPGIKTKTTLANDDLIFKGKKVLVVDDDIRNVFALGQMLEEREIIVSEADNGQSALDILKHNHDFDLILMDVMMPVMDGYEAMQIIRQTKEIKNIPIICLTAKAMKEDHENALKNGANDYLAKPLDEEKLFSMLKIWLYKN
ncbi:response regulator [Maribellus sp. CM-23]|uniref:response regulator n=1 Tax=Maribellus sp. CM-23 TaxID=2781026 RepID=UPI001F2C2039|nr:response regulator [Maribellus sp. CM-23]MCE4565386.1 response regulator [Maribellus sp. CM-23]